MKGYQEPDNQCLSDRIIKNRGRLSTQQLQVNHQNIILYLIIFLSINHKVTSRLMSLHQFFGTAFFFFQIKHIINLHNAHDILTDLGYFCYDISLSAKKLPHVIHPKCHSPWPALGEIRRCITMCTNIYYHPDQNVFHSLYLDMNT